jgi:glycosyltransferase involved in cell wall biosynthesis
MKVLLIIHESLDPFAGASGSTLKLGETYEKLGHEVSYFSIDNLPKLLQRLPFYLQKLVFPEFVAAYLSKQMKSRPFDVIDASTGDTWLWGKLRSLQVALSAKPRPLQRPLLVSRSHGLEHIYHLQYMEEASQGAYSPSWRYRFYRGGLQLWEVASSLRSADLVFVYNHYEMQYIAQHLGVPSSRIHQIKNGVIKHFAQRPFQPTPMAIDDPIRIAQVSAYTPRKGFQYSIPALNRLLSRYSQLQVSLLGTNSRPDSDAEKIYAEFDPGVRDRVTVIPRYATETLPDLLKDHHIKLFPTLCEGFGNAVIEAMACGLAPVTTNVPGPADRVVHGIDGLMIPIRDTQAIEETVEQLICDRALLDRLRRNAYAKAQSYSWDSAAKQCLALYAHGLSDRTDEADSSIVSAV